MQSLKSNALEPTRSELAALTRGQMIVRILPIYGLPILAVLLAIFFSILLPDSFPTQRASPYSNKPASANTIVLG